ncbi:protein lifeguard 2-like [Copidosoma floridanum]|uniref:protein lifeguard 2-like n=1 Tax=Copidosoma floridanum TaxID=29053 RepID=UPI0006C9CDD5|nr:protein lifeguard 2-like [Copidosoma floridanum]
MANKGPTSAGGPPQLPTLHVGQKILYGPFSVTVTESMVSKRELENQKLARRWEREQIRRARMAEMVEENYAGEFKVFNVRRRFIRRVFSILMLQLIFTAIVIAVFYFVEDARNFMTNNAHLLILAGIVFFLSYLSISLSSCARRDPPLNVVCLTLMTVSDAYLMAALTTFYSTDVVLTTVGVTTLITTVIFFTAACTKFQFDLTAHTGLMLIVSLVFFCAIIGGIFIAALQTPAVEVAITILGSFVISMFLFFDVQTMMGGKHVELNPDEVIYAASQIYVDVLMLYRYSLMLMEYAQS